MKKKILMVVEALGGGVFTYVGQLSNDMCDDFDVYIAYATRPQTPDNFREFFDSRIKLIEVKNFGKLSDVRANFKTIKELRKIEKEIKPDIIHLHSSIAGGLGRLAFKGKNNVVVYTPHGYNYLMVGENTLRGKFYKMLEKILGRKNCITLTCCKSEDDEAKKFCKKTAYIETGVNIEDLSSSLDGVEPVKNEQFTVFTLGRICFQKQPKLFNEIATLVPEAKFVWIGSGDMDHELTAPNITITGWKPRKEALAMSKGADAFILCSLGEAIAMSLIEEMYIGKLCFVSDVVGNRSVIKDGVNGYVCRKADEYAKRIKEAMKRFPVELTEQAYREVRDIYNTDVMKEKYVKFYSEIGV
ncbi:glycosyltransferase [Clostridium beijerinckii]|uniref:Putative glycosyltransferase EpsD n=1 Tax=Clostridium beijerinckii TaxID=1520 RepID=A0A1S8RV33_CLOBE|nr:glycosyltransferase [Clostridium beijerinckii]NRY62045.1 glycosyltransferase involved in cell wall biosynthesis [Clostridium beijerinckii]OOM57077.1 putative glycosyltransferase EpsD [Clostridium beijerinckii]